MITNIEADCNEAWVDTDVGTEQVRATRFEASRGFLESPPMPHPNVNDGRDRHLGA